MMSLWSWLQSPVLEPLSLSLIHFVWQGALIAIVCWIGLRAIGEGYPRARYAWTLISFGVMAIAPLATATYLFSTDIADRQEQVVANATIGDRTSPTIVADVNSLANEGLSKPTTLLVAPSSAASGVASGEVPGRLLRPASWSRLQTKIQPWLLLLWSIGCGWLSLRLFHGYLVCLRLQRGRKSLDQEVLARLQPVAERVSGQAWSRMVWASDEVIEAIAVGFIRPTILIPVAWFEQLPTSTLQAIVAHELAHIRRFDLPLNLIQRLIEMVFFFHPAVWWISQQIRFERECCCDLSAIQATGDRVLYAEALVEIAQLRLARPEFGLVASFSGGKRMTLLRRVQCLLKQPPPRGSARMSSLAFVSLLGTLVVVGSMSMFAYAGQQEQDDPAAEQRSEDRDRDQPRRRQRARRAQQDRGRERRVDRDQQNQDRPNQERDLTRDRNQGRNRSRDSERNRNEVRDRVRDGGARRDPRLDRDDRQSAEDRRERDNLRPDVGRGDSRPGEMAVGSSFSWGGGQVLGGNIDSPTRDQGNPFADGSIQSNPNQSNRPINRANLRSSDQPRRGRTAEPTNPFEDMRPQVNRGRNSDPFVTPQHSGDQNPFSRSGAEGGRNRAQQYSNGTQDFYSVPQRYSDGRAPRDSNLNNGGQNRVVPQTRSLPNVDFSDNVQQPARRSNDSDQRELLNVMRELQQEVRELRREVQQLRRQVEPQGGRPNNSGRGDRVPSSGLVPSEASPLAATDFTQPEAPLPPVAEPTLGASPAVPSHSLAPQSGFRTDVAPLNSRQPVPHSGVQAPVELPIAPSLGSGRPGELPPRVTPTDVLPSPPVRSGALAPGVSPSQTPTPPSLPASSSPPSVGELQQRPLLPSSDSTAPIPGGSSPTALPNADPRPSLPPSNPAPAGAGTSAT